MLGTNLLSRLPEILTPTRSGVVTLAQAEKIIAGEYGDANRAAVIAMFARETDYLPIPTEAI